MACKHKYGAAYPDSSQSSGYARVCGLCGDVIEANGDETCDHNWVATENVGFSSGYGYVCTMCGELGDELDPQPSHSHEWHSDGTVSPTCTESGYTNYVCNCGETRKDDYTPALGHNWVAERNDGFSSGYGYVCSRCGELGEELTCTHDNRTEVDGSRLDPTCTENGYVSYICEDCGKTWQETLPKLGHDWGDPYYSSEFSTGYGQKCNRCGYAEDRTAPYIPEPEEPEEPEEPDTPTHTHAWQKGTTVAPTCTESGYTNYYCSCGGTKTGDTTTALGHSYCAPYYSDEFSSGYGEKCVRCGDLVELDPPVTECQHTFALNKTVAATCEVEGYSLYICSKCGAQEQRDKTPALGHTAGVWVEDKAATCEVKGSKHQVCSVCGKTIKTEEIPALGHVWGTPYYSNEFSSGYGHRCTRCDETEELTKPENGGGDDGEELLIKKSTLTAIADAVREKTGGTETMTAGEIPNNIRNMRAAKTADIVTNSTATHIKPVPTDSAPYAEVVEIGGMTYKDGDTLRSAPVTEVESVEVNVIPEDYAAGYWEANASGILIRNTQGSAFSNLDYVYLPPNTTYTVTGTAQFMAVFCDKNYRLISNTSWLARGSTFTTPDVTCMTIMQLKGEWDNVMVNAGTTALPYTPYSRNTLPIPEAVRNLDAYGWGVNETCYNYIDFEKKQFVQCVRHFRLDGSTYKALQELNNSGIHAFVFETPSVKPNSQVLAANYTSLIDYISTSGNIYVNINGFLIVVPQDQTLTNCAALNNYLITNPIDICCELATPIITDISDLLPADNLIGVEGGGTVTMVNEYGYDVPNTVTFYEGKNEVVGADTFVGNLQGTAARALADGEGKQLATREWVLEQLASLVDSLSG